MKKRLPSLDPNFKPIIVAYEDFNSRVQQAENVLLTICLERPHGYNYFKSFLVFKDNTGHDDENYFIVERIIKSILWIVGGFCFKISGSKKIVERLQKEYSKTGARKFDYEFMTGVFQHELEIKYVEEKELPKPNFEKRDVSINLNGCRIGFDAGGSDRKVSAVMDGKVLYSDETVWFPKINEDPQYHLDGILDSLNKAASFLPRVDAIGVSSAGVCVDNKIMVSSLFLRVPKEKYHLANSIYTDAASKFKGAKLSLANDGDVTALSGCLELGVDKLLGIAMGTSEAGGYIGENKSLYGWLSELAFVPVDLSESAMVDEWSGDRGCGVKYFSQDGVIKLAGYGNIALDENLSPAEKLRKIQDLVKKQDKTALAIFDSIGVYLAYSIAYYNLFYEIKHVLLLGRVLSGEGGDRIVKVASETLKNVFPQLSCINFCTPDESARRVGQSIAAAGLPKI